MDELRRHAAPLVERWQRMTRSQRLAMVAVLVASAVGFSFLSSRPAENWQPIADGREFSASELAAIQNAWRRAGLKSFRCDRRKLLVPQAEAARYNDALPKSQRDSGDARDERDSPLAKANLFTSHEELEQLKDHALRNTIQRQLKALPAIADAEVNWARGKSRTAFSGRSKVTATISVMPREGHDLTPELAQSLRTVVASMVPDLSAEDIVILDQSTGLAITDQSDELIVEQQRRRQQERLARQLEAKVTAALANIPGATVRVECSQTTSLANRHLAAKPNFSSEQFSSRPDDICRVGPAALRRAGPPLSVVNSDGGPALETSLSHPTTFLQQVPEWIDDRPDDLVEFPTFIDEDNIAASPASDADSQESPLWNIAVQIPQNYFDALTAQRMLDRPTSPPGDAVTRAECDRLQQVVQGVLSLDAQQTAISINPVAATIAPHAAESQFAAWPHTACLLAALFCVTVVLRKPRPQSVPAPQANPQFADATIESAPVIEQTAPIPAASPCVEIIAESELVQLQRLAPPQLAEALRPEHPQAIAVLLTRFPTRLASECLSRLAPSLQTDVIRRLKSLGEIPEEIVNEVARTVCDRLSDSSVPVPHSRNRIAHLLPETSTRGAVV